MQYSIIIVSYNSQDEIFDCIRSVRDYGDHSVQIIVIDNASTDNTPELLQSEPGIECVCNAHNVGFSKACNQGVQLAKAPLVVFLNPDTLLEHTALSSMANVLHSTPNCMMVGPVSNAAAGIQNIRNFHPQPVLAAHVNNRFAVSRFLQKQYKGQSEWAPLLTGFCLMMRKADFEAMGGMDEKLVLGLDDLDLCWRVALQDKEARVAKDAFVFHHSQMSFSKGDANMVQAMQKKSHAAFSAKLAKHYGGLERIPSSQDLWKMDWFVPELDETAEEWVDSVAQAPSSDEGGLRLLDIAEQANHASALNPHTAPMVHCVHWQVCVFSIAQDTETMVIGSLENALARGYDDVLFVNTNGLDLPQEYYDRGVEELKISGNTAWERFFAKVFRLCTLDAVLFIRAGVVLETRGKEVLQEYFLQNPAMDIPVTGKTISFTGQEMVSSSASLTGQEQVQAQGIPYWFMVHKNKLSWPMRVIPSPAVFKYDVAMQQDSIATPPKAQPLESQSSTLSAAPSPTPELGVLSQQSVDFPSSLNAYLQQCTCPVFWGKGTVLGLDGKPASVYDADTIIMRIGLADLPGLSTVLKEWRIEKQQGSAVPLQRLVVIFDNGGLQTTNTTVAFGQPGYDYLDVQRELLLSGFAIQGVLDYKGDGLPFQADYLGHYMPDHGLLPYEKIMSTAPRILVSAVPCSEEWHLQDKVSIVLLALNKVEYTRKCIESIQNNCKQNYELILVNNGSTDGTAAYFDSIPGAIVIHNPQNLGVAKGWNQGIKKASGTYLLILNNDTIVAPGTIENLVRAAHNHPNAGVIGPRSNAIAGPQLVKDFVAPEQEIVHAAQQFQNKNALGAWAFSRIKGFCMLVPAKVIEQVGLFDEAFGMGNFEDDDYSCRIRFAGYDALVADDSFLFHYGSVSFGQAGVDWSEQMKINMQLFEKKWATGRSAYQDDPVHLGGDETHVESAYNGPNDGHNQNGQSGTAFSKTNSKNNRLPSDVGSGWDALRAGDYSGAAAFFEPQLQMQKTNARLQYGLGLAWAGLQKNNEAFGCFCRSLELDPMQKDVAQSTASHLLQKYDAQSASQAMQYLAGRFSHLQAFTSPQATQEPQADWVTMVESWLENQEYDKALQYLLALLEKGTENYQVYNLLGIAKYYRHMYQEAFDFFGKALQYNPVDSDTLMNYYDCGLRLRLVNKVESILDYAQSLQSDIAGLDSALLEIRSLRDSSQYDPEKVIRHRELNIAAENQIKEGILEHAAQSLQDLLQEDPHNYRALNNMGLVQWYTGNIDGAWEYFMQAVDKNPWYIDGFVNMYDCAVVAGKQQEYAPLLEKALQISPLHGELLQIKEWLSSGAIPERLEQYFENKQQQESVQAKVQKAQHLLESQDYNGAIILFTEVLEEQPDNLECYNGLGIISFYRREYDDAYKLLMHALKINPLDNDTLLNYWDVAKEYGKEEEARMILENAVAMDPSLSQVREALL
jgi:GT2 family glycosyltransferase/tetratricopeptide (TPR) repeat protein